MFKRQESTSGLLFEFTTELQNIDRVASELRAFLSSRGLDSIQFGAGLACREGVVNAMRHGNDMSIERLVRCELSFDGTRLCISVEDQGPGWDWKSHKTCLPDPTCESGRGLYLISQYACEMEYNAAGNRLCIHINTCGE